MSFFNFPNISITGVSTAVPKNIRKSEDFIEKYGEEVFKFIEMTGIKEVHVASKYQTVSDLGFAAAENLLSVKNIDRADIGLLVFGAHSVDYRRPATACVLHKRLGLNKNCAAFDVGLGCSAFVYTLQIVSSMLLSSDVNKALLIVGETVSKMANPEDKSVSMLFGDAGSAILIEKEPETNISGSLYTDGSGYKAIIAPAGGFRNLDADKTDFEFEGGIKRNLYNVWMDGSSVFSFTISDVPKSIKAYLEKENKTVEDYDYFIMHQANQFIHRQLAKKLKIPVEKMPLSLDRYGNTSAAAIPLTICDAFGNDNTNRKLHLLASGFGVGLSWGVTDFWINTEDVLPILETEDYYKEGLILSPEEWLRND